MSNAVTPPWILVTAVARLVATDREDAIRALASRLFPGPSSAAQEIFTYRAVERERLSSTFAGHGLAVPHARVPHPAGAVAIAMAHVPGGMDWSPAGDSVQWIALVAITPEASADYLRFLQRLSRFVRHPADRTAAELLTHDDELAAFLERALVRG